MRSLIVVLSLSFCSSFFAQKSKDQLEVFQFSTETKSHARALKVIGDILYIGTSNGEVFSLDLNTKKLSIFERKQWPEIRDIEVIGEKLYAMTSGDSSFLISYSRTSAKTISVQPFYGIFLDGLAQLNETLFLMGDPSDEAFSLYYLINDKDLFTKTKSSPIALKNEAAFAASGSTVHILNNGDFLFVSGGEISRLFRSRDRGSNWEITDLPFPNCVTCGPYSMAITDNQRWVLVGGDYLKPNERNSTCYYSSDEGKTWKVSTNSPYGYRSSIISSGSYLYACGTNGIDYSKDGGKTWKRKIDGNYFALAISDNLLIASTINGEIHLFDLIK